MTPLLLTEEQAAAQLAVCPRTLRKARQQGDLRYVLIGRAVRYTMPDLQAYVESLSRKEEPCPKAQTPPPRRNQRRSGQIVPFTARAR